MAKLVVRRYRTKLFLKLADHTYVECGTGAKGWGCWGGKTGGNFLRDAPGSTLRADAIAGPKERAGITRYLINGVCHQAANRTLFPAGITVDGALGYTLSVSLFGMYGRPNGFDNRADVSGDLPECEGSPESIEQPVSFNAGRLDFNDPGYMQAINALYLRATLEEAISPQTVRDFQMAQFQLLVDHKLGNDERITASKRDALLTARERFEVLRLEAEDEFGRTGDASAFIAAFDQLTLKFQDDAAASLDPSDYQAMFNLSPDERYLLADPNIVAAAYGALPDGSPDTGG